MDNSSEDKPNAAYGGKRGILQEFCPKADRAGKSRMKKMKVDINDLSKEKFRAMLERLQMG
jgi:hypothetical protein